MAWLGRRYILRTRKQAGASSEHEVKGVGGEFGYLPVEKSTSTSGTTCTPTSLALKAKERMRACSQEVPEMNFRCVQKRAAHAQTTWQTCRTARSQYCPSALQRVRAAGL